MAVVYAAEDVRAAAPRRAQGAAARPRVSLRRAGALRARGADGGAAESSAHRAHLCRARAGGHGVLRDGTRERRECRRAAAREPRPPVAFIAAVLEQTADALAYAHASGVVHRDVKPDNILLDRESGRAMVTDFGIARAAESGSRLTQTGIAVGTPAFMSPEQATGEKDVDGRSDMYSLGRGRLSDARRPAAVRGGDDAGDAHQACERDAAADLVGAPRRAAARSSASSRSASPSGRADRWDSALALRDALRRVQRDGSLRRAAGDSAPAAIPTGALATLPTRSHRRRVCAEGRTSRGRLGAAAGARARARAAPTAGAGRAAAHAAVSTAAGRPPTATRNASGRARDARRCAIGATPCSDQRRVDTRPVAR